MFLSYARQPEVDFMQYKFGSVKGAIREKGSLPVDERCSLLSK